MDTYKFSVVRSETKSCKITLRTIQSEGGDNHFRTEC